MYNKSLLNVIIGLSVLTIGMIAMRMVKKSGRKTTYTFGILKTVSHPALDLTEQGFMETIKAQLGNDVTFIQQNADGSVLQAGHCAQSLHADESINAVLAIATPAALALHKAEKEKPIIVAAVTDPTSVGLLDGTTNVCGCSDMIDVKGEIDMLEALVPHAQTIGIVYNPTEQNSCLLATMMSNELARRSKKAHHIMLHSEAELVPTIKQACRTVDALLAPNDNLVASCMTSIAHTARSNKIPFMASFTQAVDQGALAACGVNYYEVGRQAALLTLETVIKGTQPSALPIRTCASTNMYINKAVLTELEIQLPPSLEKKAVLIDNNKDTHVDSH